MTRTDYNTGAVDLFEEYLPIGTKVTKADRKAFIDAFRSWLEEDMEVEILVDGADDEFEETEVEELDF